MCNKHWVQRLEVQRWGGDKAQLQTGSFSESSKRNALAVFPVSPPNFFLTRRPSPASAAPLWQSPQGDFFCIGLGFKSSTSEGHMGSAVLDHKGTHVKWTLHCDDTPRGSQWGDRKGRMLLPHPFLEVACGQIPSPANWMPLGWTWLWS